MLKTQEEFSTGCSSECPLTPRSSSTIMYSVAGRGNSYRPQMPGAVHVSMNARTIASTELRFANQESLSRLVRLHCRLLLERRKWGTGISNLSYRSKVSSETGLNTSFRRTPFSIYYVFRLIRRVYFGRSSQPPLRRDWTLRLILK